jgi:prepilin-type N-terminal cleavage/methylation domain-containing protein
MPCIPLPRRAFTLVELLTVIGIIVILMSLVVGGVSIAKRKGQEAKASAQITSIAAAITQFRSLNGAYPEARLDTGSPPQDIYQRVFESAGEVRAWSAVPYPGAKGSWKDGSPPVQPATPENDSNPGWGLIASTLADQLSSIEKLSLTDPWKQVIRYRPAKWYPFLAGTAVPPIDRETDCPAPDDFQLWSCGYDETDNAGTGDDRTSWKK